MFVYEAGRQLGDFAELCVDGCCAQGVPSVCHVVQVC